MDKSLNDSVDAAQRIARIQSDDSTLRALLATQEAIIAESVREFSNAKSQADYAAISDRLHFARLANRRVDDIVERRLK